MTCAERELLERCAKLCETHAGAWRADGIPRAYFALINCAAGIRALAAPESEPARDEGVTVPRELRDLLDSVSALDTFNIENPRDFSRMPSYIQVIHKRLFKEWGIVRAMLSAAPQPEGRE